MNKKILIVFVGLGLFSLNLLSYAKITALNFASEIYPPFTTIDSNQQPTGFDLELAQAICAKLQITCTFKIDQFKNMRTSLQEKKYDAWISAITISHERKQDITFTIPYFDSTAKLLATKKSVFNGAPAEIRGKTIGVVAHTCYIDFLQKTYGNTIKIKTFPNQNDTLQALDNGLVDAIIDDAIALSHWRSLKSDPKQYRLIGLPAKYSQLVWHKYGIAVAKDNHELAAAINHAIRQIKADGTYKRLIRKHFANS